MIVQVQAVRIWVTTHLAVEIPAAAAAVVQQVKSKTAMATVAQTPGLRTATVMTAPTNGMVLRFISTVTNLNVTVATAPVVAAAVVQQVKSKTAMATVAQTTG
jgi:hypothetical protein